MRSEKETMHDRSNRVVKNAHSIIVDIAIMQSLFEGKERDVKPFVAKYGMISATLSSDELEFLL